MNIRVQLLAAAGASAALALPGYCLAEAQHNEHRPVCSPDGSRIVYMLQSERTGNDWELYLLERDSQKRTRLTDHEGWDGYAVWSPDGNRIVFDRADGPEGRKSPWVMDLRDYSLAQLGEYEGWLSVSDWRADGTLLAFHELGGQRDLVLLDASGRITGKLTDTPGSSEHDAHFSPDGRRVAYAGGAPGGANTTLELLDLETREAKVLRTSPGRIYGIDWTPEGDRLAFVDAPGGEEDDADIFIYRLADHSVRRVTDDPAWDHMPEFCADSDVLLFTSYRSGEERIYRVDPDPALFLNATRR